MLSPSACQSTTHRGPADMIGHYPHTCSAGDSRTDERVAAHLLRRTELRHGAVEHVEVIEEIHSCQGGFVNFLECKQSLAMRTVHSKPLIKILAFGEKNGLTQIATALKHRQEQESVTYQ